MSNDNFQLTDKSGQIKKEALEKCVRAMEACGLKAEAFAIKSCPVDTGLLKNSITHVTYSTENNEVETMVGTPVEYGIYVEMGTGQYVAGGRKTPWVYEDSKGETHLTHGSRPQPFIKPAISDHISLYKRMIESELKK